MAITLNDNIQNNSPKSLDNKYLSNGTTLWSSVAAANAGVISAYRHRGLKVLIDIGGEAVEYWWKHGTTNSDLIPVQLDKFTLVADGSKALVVNEFVKRVLINPASELSALKIGTTVGGDEIMPEQTIPAGAWYNVTLERFVGSATTLYFTGVTSSTQFRLYYE